MSLFLRKIQTYPTAKIVKTEIHQNFQTMNFKLLDQALSSVLVLLWTYTGLDKIISFEKNLKALHNQIFSGDIAEILSYTIPGIELLLALFLVLKTTRWWGYLGSTLLLCVFTTYIGLIWIGAFPRVPCTCAGIFESISWTTHLIVNNIFLICSALGLWTLGVLNKKFG